MPFVQMENISHFLRTCQSPPLNLPQHDTFLTVDLYESKDPAQVVQCIIAFSRRANAVQPNTFPTIIGGKSKGGVLSPQGTGNGNVGRFSTGVDGTYNRSRGASNVSDSNSTSFNPISRATADRMSPVRTGGSNSSATNGGKATSPAGPVSSWSKKSDEGNTAPAWNIHQYGYMGGASQGNQGITFGGRRQITSPAPKVPSIADKERRRREEEAEKEQLRIQAEEAEHKRRVEREAEEERDKIAEERRWAEETRKQREHEREEAEKEKRRWEEEERKWREEEDERQREEKEAEARIEREKQRKRAGSDARLKGQFLSQYHAEQRKPSKNLTEDTSRSGESDRVRELERELEQAKERERQYQLERQQRMQIDGRNERLRVENLDLNSHMRDKERRDRSRSRSREPVPLHVQSNKNEAWRASERDYLRRKQSRSRSREPAVSHSQSTSDESWRASERDYLRREWGNHHREPFGTTPSPEPTSAPRPLPDPTHSAAPSSRPLPDPATYASPNPAPTQNRTDRFLATNPAPAPTQPRTHFPAELGLTSTSEAATEDERRRASQTATKAGGWASKSLLEREMERERQRQQEWEESQMATQEAATKGVRDGGSGTGPGESWDVNQYGYLGGENQGKSGVAFGARRQIIGPRPRP